MTYNPVEISRNSSFCYNMMKFYISIVGALISGIASHSELIGVHAAIGGVEEAQWLLSQFEGRPYGPYFDLRGNPWVMPPEAVVEHGFAAIKTYYTDVQMAIEAGAEVTQRRLLKAVLVGASSAGKTR